MDDSEAPDSNTSRVERVATDTVARAFPLKAKTTTVAKMSDRPFDE
jgi:hypothetical protein